MATYIHGTAPDEQQRLALLNQLTNPAFLDWLPLKPGLRVLEVGSGLGLLARAVAGRIGTGGAVTGLEYAEAQIATSERLRTESVDRSPVTFVQGDAHLLPFPDGSFDLVYCRYVLEHVADPVRVLAEMRRVARPGATVAAQENDLRAVAWHPTCPAFDHAWAAFCSLQIELGGDPWLGRKLHALFLAAGFAAPVASLAPEVHLHGDPTFTGWVDNLIGNLASAELALMETGRLDPAEFATAVAELEALKARPDAAAFFYWNRLMARRD